MNRDERALRRVASLNIRKSFGQLPAKIDDNGFVRDLRTELTNVADSFNLPLYTFLKNGRYWFALPIPLESELPGLELGSGGVARDQELGPVPELPPPTA